jgi:SAM-dependent methyltransferase
MQVSCLQVVWRKNAVQTDEACSTTTIATVSITDKMKNIDDATVSGFGDEWSRFDQTGMSDHEREEIFNNYFSIFPWDSLQADAVGFDLGCGSGRWANVVARRVGILHCIDPSDAIDVARRNLVGHPNCVFHRASVDNIPVEDMSMDFGYSLGVLHHIPDTQAALSACVAKLKCGAPFLVYLYYAFDNKPSWFRLVWTVSETLRGMVSRLPYAPRYWASQFIATFVYWPLARVAKLASLLGMNVANFPLSIYRDRSFYVMRTDSLDRFGTRLEQRFTRSQIESMMVAAGLTRIRFRDDMPFWCAVGFKSPV